MEYQHIQMMHAGVNQSLKCWECKYCPYRQYWAVIYSKQIRQGNEVSTVGGSRTTSNCNVAMDTSVALVHKNCFSSSFIQRDVV